MTGEFNGRQGREHAAYLDSLRKLWIAPVELCGIQCFSVEGKNGMQLLLVTRRFPPAPGGVERLAGQIVVRLARRGHIVRICTSDLYREIPFQRLPHKHHTSKYAGVEIDRSTAIPIPGRRKEGTTWAPSILASILRKSPPNIVHCFGLNLFSVSASLYARSLWKCKTLCTTHVDPGTLSRPVLSKILSRFDGLVALTEVERKQMVRQGLEESKIRVIPNGLDLEEYKNLPSRESFRTKTGITNHLILYAGRLDSASKGCDILVKAVSLVQQRVGRCTVVLAGPDWGSQQYLEQLSSSLGVSAVFTGNLTHQELISAFAACDVFVMPSIREAFGLSILESMACGAPIVATNVGGIPELVQNEVTGILVPAGDSWSLANAICRVLQDFGFSSRLTANAKSCASLYSIENTVAELESFYKDILST